VVHSAHSRGDRSGAADRGDVELELDALGDEHTAGLERGVPGEAPLLAVDGCGALEADPEIAEGVARRAGLLELDRDGLGGALVRSPVTSQVVSSARSTPVETKVI